MSLIVTQKLYIDVDLGIAYARFNDFSRLQTPIIYAGDTAKLQLYLVRTSRNNFFPMETVAFTTANITAAIGTPGGTPAASGTTWTAIATPAATYSAPVLTIPSDAVSGYFTLTLTNASPSLTATTSTISLTASSADIETAIESAVNAQSGWSAATAVITQTGPGKFTVTVSATNTTTVYALTVAVTSTLTGVPGYEGSLALTGAGVSTLLGANTEVTTTLEVQCNTGSGYQTYLQIPCTLRAQVTNP
jgi:hypothetical protein